MQIFYFAAARAAAGVNSEHVEGQWATLGELLADRAAAHTGTTDAGMTLAQIFDRCTFLIDGRKAQPEAPLGEDTQRVDVLPPFAGG